MSQTMITTTGTPPVTTDMAPLYLKIKRDMLHGLKKVALENDCNVHDVAVEAFNDFLHKNRHLVEKQVSLKM